MFEGELPSLGHVVFTLALVIAVSPPVHGHTGDHDSYSLPTSEIPSRVSDEDIRGAKRPSRLNNLLELLEEDNKTIASSIEDWEEALARENDFYNKAALLHARNNLNISDRSKKLQELQAKLNERREELTREKMEQEISELSHIIRVMEASKLVFAGEKTAHDKAKQTAENEIHNLKKRKKRNQEKQESIESAREALEDELWATPDRLKQVEKRLKQTRITVWDHGNSIRAHTNNLTDARGDINRRLGNINRRLGNINRKLSEVHGTLDVVMCKYTFRKDKSSGWRNLNLTRRDDFAAIVGISTDNCTRGPTDALLARRHGIGSREWSARVYFPRGCGNFELHVLFIDGMRSYDGRRFNKSSPSLKLIASKSECSDDSKLR